jgi:O-methyltransferase
MSDLKSKIRDVLDRIRTRPKINERIRYWAYSPEFRYWCRAHPCESVPDRYALYQWLLNNEGLNSPVDYIEFGVSKGDSIRWWVENNRHQGSTFVGFDTFEGIPEAWGPWPKGSFTAGGNIPAIADARCTFIKGFFDSTVPTWLGAHQFERRTVLHLDADIYSSTLLVLTQFLATLKTDSILIFDEFGDPLHEYRAYQDATAAYRRASAPVVRSENWSHVAIKLI